MLLYIKYIYNQVIGIKYIFNQINMYFINKKSNFKSNFNFNSNFNSNYSLEIYKYNLSNVDWNNIHYY